MVRFVHTADLQLGRKATDATQRGERQRQARLQALRNLVDLARREAADFVVIVGDLFEDNQVKPVTVQQALQLLQSAAPIPVYLLPGNHDALGPGSVYERDDFRSRPPGNLFLLREPEPVEAPGGCVLYPCPQRSSYPEGDPLEWLPERGADRAIRVALVHGNLPGIAELSTDPCPSFNPATAAAKGVDYTALGHWHGRIVAPDSRWAYPGTPEPGTFGEQKAGEALLVSIAGPGDTPQITPHAVGTLQWLRWAREVRGAGDLARLQEEVESLPAPGDTLLRIHLEGHLRVDELTSVEDLAVWLQARVANGQLLSAELLPRLDTSEALAGALQTAAEADPLVARVVADLRRLASPEAGATTSAEQPSRPLDELLESWTRLQPPPELRMSEVAAEALTILARRAKEVHSA